MKVQLSAKFATLNILAAFVPMTFAAEESTTSNDFQLKKTFNLTVGTSIRTDSPDPSVIGGLAPRRLGLPAGQLSATGNAGSSNLNFEKNKPVSTVIKAIGSLELTNGKSGFFIRAKAWHDYALTDENHPYGNYPNRFTLNNKLSDNGFEPEAKFSNARLVDTYVYNSFTTQDNQEIKAKLGRQFLNWGNSYFFTNGINIINPINFPGLTRPGATPEESKLAVGMLHLETNISNARLETFYQYEFIPTALNGCGTFYAPANYVQPGCNFVAVVPGLNESQSLASGVYGHRAPDNLPESKNQFGIAAHFAHPSIATNTHLYFINYHSRNPSLQGINTTIPNSSLLARIADPAGMKYAVAYPENIRLFGFSFDAKLQNNTKAFGEISIRPNQPITLNSADLLDAMLSQNPNAALNLAGKTSNLPLGATFDAYDKFKVTNISTGFLNESKLLGAAKTITLAEIGASHIAHLPNHGSVRYGRSDDYGVGAINGVTCTASAKTCSHDGYITSNSWGLRFRVANIYPNAIYGITLTPSLFVSKDIEGNSFDGSFVEGRTMLRPALRADWSKSWYSEILINKISGGDYNTMVDRSTLTFMTGMVLQ
jgi:Protein of unknown function (DUF1302)